MKETFLRNAKLFDVKLGLMGFLHSTSIAKMLPVVTSLQTQIIKDIKSQRCSMAAIAFTTSI